MVCTHKLHTKTPDGEAEGSIMFRSVGVQKILYQTFKDFGSLQFKSLRASTTKTKRGTHTEGLIP